MSDTHKYSHVYNLGLMIQAGMRKGVDFEMDDTAVITRRGIYFPSMGYWRYRDQRITGSGADFAEFYFSKKEARQNALGHERSDEGEQ